MIELAPIIEHPKWNKNYKNYIEEKQRIIREDEEKQAKEEEKKAMRAIMNNKEFNLWNAKQRYKTNREKILQQRRDNTKLYKKEARDYYYETFWNTPPLFKTEREKELELLEKYKADFVNNKGWFVQYRWCTPIWYCRSIPNFTKPIKIIPNHWINNSIVKRLQTQHKIYNFVKPYINEIHKWDFCLKKQQQMFNKIQYMFKPNTKIFELHKAKGISQNVMAMMVDAIKNDKWIASLPYLGRCVLCGDRVYTSMWNIFMVSPYNNYKYLTEETLDKVHNDTQKFLKEWTYKCALAKYNYCYLIKVPKDIIEKEEWEWEKEILRYDYYIVPLGAKARSNIHEKEYNLVFKKW